jgi:DNA-binding LacI/PurR family transcriptional regulator
MLSSGDDLKEKTKILTHLHAMGIKGVVIYPVITSPEGITRYAQMINSCTMPLVFAELALPGMGCPAVVVDGFHAGYVMTRHLLDRGLKKVGFLSEYAWTPFVRDRYLGYRQALEERGIGETGVMLTSHMTPNYIDPLSHPPPLVSQYLESCVGGVEGVVCSNDFLAHGMLRECVRRGIRVPHDFSVAGIDDYSFSRDTSPGLTTYRIPYEEIGRVAFDLLRSRVENQPPSVLEHQKGSVFYVLN